MQEFPFISVIVPVHNGKRFFEACLNSLKRQTYENYEIIIVNDGSSDGSPNLVTPPARLISTPSRNGAGPARNLGAEAARGDYLLFTDADTETPADWIEKTVRTIVEKNVQCGGGGYAGPVEDTFIQWFAFEELAWRRRNCYGEVEALVSNNLFCERELFLASGGFPKIYDRAGSEDMEFSWKLSRNHKLWWDQTNGVLHNFHPTVKAYLSQQSRFARNAVPMFLSNKKLVMGKTYHSKSFYLEVALTGLAVLLIIVLQPLGALLCILGVLYINRGMLRAMRKKHRQGFVFGSILLIFARNVTIILHATHKALQMPFLSIKK